MMNYRIREEYLEAGDGSNYPDFVIEEKEGNIWFEITRCLSQKTAEQLIGAWENEHIAALSNT